MQHLEKRIKTLEQAKPGNFAHFTDAELVEQIEIYRALVAVESADAYNAAAMKLDEVNVQASELAADGKVTLRVELLRDELALKENNRAKP